MLISTSTVTALVILFQMDISGEHVRDVFSTLYKYHLDNFLCDLVITTPDGTEVHAHSIVLSAVCSVLHFFTDIICMIHV